jgi:flagellin-like protein
MEFDDRGVSPVIGTVLMIGITVVAMSMVSAVILTHVTNLGSSPPNVILDTETDQDTYTITVGGGSPEQLTVYVNGTNYQTIENVDLGDQVQVENPRNGTEIIVTVTGDGYTKLVNQETIQA